MVTGRLSFRASADIRYKKKEEKKKKESNNNNKKNLHTEKKLAYLYITAHVWGWRMFQSPLCPERRRLNVWQTLALNHFHMICLDTNHSRKYNYQSLSSRWQKPILRTNKEKHVSNRCQAAGIRQNGTIFN